jgi:hypothetical protein
MLLEAGADANSSYVWADVTPIGEAARGGHLSTMRPLVLEGKADLEGVNCVDGVTVRQRLWAMKGTELRRVLEECGVEDPTKYLISRMSWQLERSGSFCSHNLRNKESRGKF